VKRTTLRWKHSKRELMMMWWNCLSSAKTPPHFPF